MVINATSAGFEGGNIAKITIDNIEVKCVGNSEHDSRGLHLVIINPHNGHVEKAEVFDTFKSSASIEAFIFNYYVDDGFIVVAACKDECATELSYIAKCWFKNMGSTLIDDLEYRQAFAFIGTMENESSANEKRGRELTDSVSVSQVVMTNAHPNEDDDMTPLKRYLEVHDQDKEKNTSEVDKWIQEAPGKDLEVLLDETLDKMSVDDL